MTGWLVTLGYCMAAIGAGLLAFRALKLDRRPNMPEGACALIFGQALLAAIWLLLGLAGWLKPLVVWLVLAASFAASVPLLVTWLRSLGTTASAILGWWQNESFCWRLLALCVAVFAALLAVAAWLKPPFGDAEAFYVTYARVIAATGRIEPMPGLYETFSSIGMIGEPQFAALIAISGVPAAKLFVWPLAMAMVAVLLAIGRIAGLQHRDNLILLVLLFTTTAFTHHIWDGKVDLFAAALGILAVFWILSARGAANSAPLALAGLAAGFSVVAKFSYAISLAPAILVLLLWPRKLNASEKGPVAAFVIVGIYAAVATLPHLIKNAIMFGAPLAPFIGGAPDQNWLQQVWFAPDVVRRIIATYPLALAYGRYPMQGGNLSFLLIAFLPLLWWMHRAPRLRDSLLFQLCMAGLAGTLVWMALRPSIIAPRYLLATLLLYYPLIARAAGAAASTENKPGLLGFSIAACAGTALVIFSHPLLPIGAEGARQLTGRTALPCALASAHCVPLQTLNREAAPGARVYALNYYLYWMRDDLLQCRDRGIESKRIRLLGGAGLSWQWLLDHGFEWLVIDNSSHAKDLTALLSSPLPDGLKLQILHQGEGISLIRLNYDSGSRTPACQQVHGDTWRVLNDAGR